MLHATEIRPDLIGWWDRVSHGPWEWGFISVEDAEFKYGAAIYREGERPEHLIPIFDAEYEIREGGQ